ncbi:hypothetical protein [Streptomyces griseoflavus]|uniref:hypothetical protein n=1 Tax=Streptomyces griseoflavus TaxID=35619 RepID=UPI00167EF2E7|nr:hypothetical protein [Streptomyces griseoflavus]GGV33568.1 hypothetical protein GCM10010293_35430 [Streptomyces griseoflavus]
MTHRRRVGEQELKHLELLQSVISRLGSNSFVVKGWCITLSGLLIAVADRVPAWKPVTVSVAVAVGFWLLDGYYLRQERLFRSLYERVARGEDPPPTLTMDAERYGGPVPWPSALLSRPLLFCYGVLVVADSLLILALS